MPLLRRECHSRGLEAEVEGLHLHVDHSLPETTELDMSKRLDEAMRRVKEMSPSFQERAIIRLQTLIREWDTAPHNDNEDLRQRLRRKLHSVGRLLKRSPGGPLRSY